jgi:hypothetical protein
MPDSWERCAGWCLEEVCLARGGELLHVGAVRFYLVVFTQECLGMSSMSRMQELVATCVVTTERRLHRDDTLPCHLTIAPRHSQGFTRAELDVYWAMQSIGNNSRVNAVTGGEQG